MPCPLDFDVGLRHEHGDTTLPCHIVCLAWSKHTERLALGGCHRSESFEWAIRGRYEVELACYRLLLVFLVLENCTEVGPQQSGFMDAREGARVEVIPTIASSPVSSRPPITCDPAQSWKLELTRERHCAEGFAQAGLVS